VKIAFVYNAGRPSAFKGKTYEMADSGGSEGSAVNYAFALVSLGHEVHMYTPGTSPVTYRGVEWRDIQTRARFEEKYDAAIAIRFPLALRGMAAKVKALYCCDPAVSILPAYIDSGDVHLVITISEHQTQRFRKLYAISEEMFLISNAGVVWADYDRSNVVKRRGRCIYCSVPQRGLRALEGIWPLIRQQVPWATLHVTGDMELWGIQNDPRIEDLCRRMEELAGVTMLGLLSREELIQEQLQSQVMLLPGNPISPEMCCMAAMECAAARNALLVTDLYALPERVIGGHTGYIVPRGANWHRRYAATAVQLLMSLDLSVMQYWARAVEREHDYGVLAQQWVRRLEELL